MSSSNKQNGKTNSAQQANPHLRHIHPIHHNVLSMSSLYSSCFSWVHRVHSVQMSSTVHVESHSFMQRTKPEVVDNDLWGESCLQICRLSSLYSPFLDVYRRQKGWLIPSVWTHKTEELARFSIAGVKCKIFYYEVAINVWRDKGCTLALMKHRVIPSTQNTNEQILFLQLAMAVVYWGFLQECGLQGPHLET